LQFAHARPDEVLAARKESGLLWLPVGPLEWHGPHLPFGVDALNAEATALACAGRSGGLVLPTLYCGTEREREPRMLSDLGLDSNAHIVGMDFPRHSLPSGYFPEEEFALQVRGWIERAREWQFHILVIVNGHGAQNHNAVLERLVQAYRPTEAGIDVLAFLALVAEPGGALNVGHAAADETSLMLQDYPDDVALEYLPPAITPLACAEYGIVDDLTFRGDPTPQRTLRPEDDPRLHANTERGRAMRERTVDFICRTVENFRADSRMPRTNLSTTLTREVLAL
jgi:creatinine amidohydrolase